MAREAKSAIRSAEWVSQLASERATKILSSRFAIFPTTVVCSAFLNWSLFPAVRESVGDVQPGGDNYHVEPFFLV